MKGLKQTYFILGIVTILIALFSFAGIANALDIVLEPSVIQREIGAKTRVQIYADPAVDLISMGVKVTFDPAVLQVESAAKYEDFTNGWIMDADGDLATTSDQYVSPAVEIDNTNGTVTMIGGRLIGSDTIGLSGKVLLGWIFFNAIADGNANLTIDLAKENPNPTETFDNFVRLSGTTGTVDEPTNVPGDLAVICVSLDACGADINNDGRVNVVDLGLLRQEFGRINCNEPGEYCQADLDIDGRVNVVDLGLLRNIFGRIDCPICN